jgi:hypothetical protein
LVLSAGPTVPLTRDSTFKERSTEMESSHGLTIQPTLANSMITISMAQAFMNGLTAASSLESGAITRWRAMEPSPGQTAVVMSANMLMT